MDDAEFAALERRLGPVLAEGGRGHVSRHDVEALLRECRRLRGPPDVSGLLTAAEVGDLRKRLSALSIPALDHLDAQAALIRNLYAVVADLHEDHGPAVAAYERGRAEGREEAAALAGRELPVSDLADLIRDIGPCRPPLPPSEAEREAARLREALRQCLERLERMSGTYGTSSATAQAIDAARKALGEGP